jgi:thiamine biosynthesis protein ThiI
LKEIILVKNGELALKGLNRSGFEDILVKNIRRRLRPFGEFEYQKSQSTVMIIPKGDVDMDGACDAVGRVFGIAGYARAAAVEKDMDVILSCAPDYLRDSLEAASTFKVNAKRSDKAFPLKSPEISALLGGKLLECYPHLTVDVHNPDVTVTVEIRDTKAFIRANQIKGAGGMPVGTGGRAALLISGGIDSPVAGYMMAKRGIQLTAIHFASPPFTSVQAEEKVHALLRQVAKYSGHIHLITVGFTEIQQEIRRSCPEPLFTLIMRRFMMRIADSLAVSDNCAALITGESVGQVASQTIYALGCTDAVTTLPVFRPLIGMDKDEIIAVSRKIETFDISIQPFEDCYTVFTPKHPRTRPTIPLLEEAEKALDVDGLVKKALGNIKILEIEA